MHPPVLNVRDKLHGTFHSLDFPRAEMGQVLVGACKKERDHQDTSMSWLLVTAFGIGSEYSPLYDNTSKEIIYTALEFL